MKHFAACYPLLLVLDCERFGPGAHLLCPGPELQTELAQHVFQLATWSLQTTGAHQVEMGDTI